MRKTLLISFLFALFNSAFSQQDSLLKNFKYRISHYRAVTINIAGSGQFSKSDFTAASDNNRAGAGSLGASYFFMRSTDKILLNTYAAVSSSFTSSKYENALNDSRNDNSYSTAHFNVLNKWFSGKNFTELGADITTGLATSKITSTLPNSYKSNNFDQALSVTLGIGKGRLENITDMQNALWLYKTLAEENKFSRHLSPDELNELGRTITTANNTRVPDTRKRTQFMLETVDGYFQGKGLISSADIRYFSSLNDILFFAFNNARKSGTERFIRLIPSLHYYSKDRHLNNLSDKNENRVTIKGISLSAGVSSHRPVNLKHQNNLGISLNGNYILHDFSDKFFTSGTLMNSVKLNPAIKQAAANLFFQHAIYPNTRTTISFTLNSETGYQDVEGESSFFGRVDISGTMFYFISYRTRFTCNLGVAYLKNYYQVYQYLELFPDNIQLFANAGIEVNL